MHQRAYAAVAYLRMECTDGNTQITLVTSKTLLNGFTIPRLELCGLLTRLMDHVRVVLDVPPSQSFTWTDSTIVLHWLVRSAKRFKT